MELFHSLAAADARALPGTAAVQESRGDAPAPVVKADLLRTARAAESFTMFTQAIEAAGLAETLKQEGPFTVFAPTDGAFAMLPQGALAALLHHKEALAAILACHVVAGKFSSEDLTRLPMVKAVDGQDLKVIAADGKLMVANATVTQADIPASNGVIHAVDAVLLPE